MKNKFLTILILIILFFTTVIQNLSCVYAVGKAEEFKSRADKLDEEYMRVGNTWMTQRDMNFGTGEYYLKWDNLLNEVYQYLKSTLSNAEFEKLKADQIKWIKEKKAKAAVVAKDWEGGSGQPMAVNDEKIQLTTKRVYYLISLIKDSQNKASQNIKKISVILNGQMLSFLEQPYIENSTIMVPMRTIFEALGASIDYNKETKTIMTYRGNTAIKLIIGSARAEINGVSKVMSVAATNKNGNTMIPLRFISEALGADVSWNANINTATINLY